MGRLLTAALPAWLPLALVGLLIAAVAWGYFSWRGSLIEQGRQECQAEARQKLDEQRAADKVTSDRLLAGKDTYIRELESQARPVVEVVKYVQSSCPADAALRSAADFVRKQLAPGTSGPPAGRTP